MKIRLIFLFSILFVCACGSSRKIIKPQGDIASLTIDNEVYKGELLTISKNALLFLHKENVFEVPLDSIQNLYVDGYSSRDDKLLPTILTGTAAIIYTGIASNVGLLEDSPEACLVFIPPLILIPYSYFTGNPNMNFSPQSDKDVVEKIQRYCRFPQDLNQDQIILLLKHYNQENFFQVFPGV